MNVFNNNNACSMFMVFFCHRSKAIARVHVIYLMNVPLRHFLSLPGTVFSFCRPAERQKAEWVDLGRWLRSEMVYLPVDGTNLAAYRLLSTVRTIFKGLCVWRWATGQQWAWLMSAALIEQIEAARQRSHTPANFIFVLIQADSVRRQTNATSR